MELVVREAVSKARPSASTSEEHVSKLYCSCRRFNSYIITNEAPDNGSALDWLPL